eukprot:2494512-Lingulodinium_polyedra.AAC.1
MLPLLRSEPSPPRWAGGTPAQVPWLPPKGLLLELPTCHDRLPQGEAVAIPGGTQLACVA